MGLTGTFLLESNTNYDAWLKTVGVPDEVAARMVAAKPKLESSDTADGMTVKTISGDKTFSNTIVFGKDSEIDVAGLKYSINAKKTATGYSGTLRLGSKTGTLVVEATDKGFTQTVTVDGVTAKKVYIKQ